jgi:hypothetical protein
MLLAMRDLAMPARGLPRVCGMVALALLAAAVAGGCAERRQRARDAKAIRAVFETYQDALLRQDGDAAAAVVDAATLDYYDQARKLALSAPAEHVRRLPITERIQVLTIRHLFDFDTASRLDGRGVFRFFVNEGWAGGSRRSRESSIGEVAIEGDQAQGVHLVRGEATPMRWLFRREDRAWKLSLKGMLPLADQAIAEAVRKTSLTEDEFVLKVIEKRTLRAVSDRVWQPLGVSARLN